MVGFTQVLAILAEAYKCDSLSEAAKFLMILKGHKIVAMIDSKILWCDFSAKVLKVHRERERERALLRFVKQNFPILPSHSQWWECVELRSRNSNASLDKERKIGYVGLCRSPSEIRTLLNDLAVNGLFIQGFYPTSFWNTYSPRQVHQKCRHTVALCKNLSSFW